MRAEGGASCPWAIGEPGRAALEVPPGAPAMQIGHADIEISSASVAGALVRAATMRGLLHRWLGEPRQDAFALAWRSGEASGDERTDALIAVVCDGVGSLGRSHEAARFVSCGLAAAGVEGVPWPDAFARVNEQLLRFAEQAMQKGEGDRVVDGMATTAVAIAVCRESRNWVGDVAWVGDSPAWHLDAKGHWNLIGGAGANAADAEYYSTSVRALPSAGGACERRELQLDDGSLFLMSDGVGNPLKWSDDVQAALAGWWSEPPDPCTFGAQVDFARKSHMDDRTVVGVWADQSGPGAS